MVISDNGKVLSRLIRAEMADFSFNPSRVTKLPPPVRCISTAIDDRLLLKYRATAAGSQVALIKGMFKYLTLYPDIKLNPVALAVSPAPLLVERVSGSISMDGIIDIPDVDSDVMMATMKASVAVSLPRILGAMYMADRDDADEIRRNTMKEFMSNIVTVLNLPPNKVTAAELDGSQYISYAGIAMFTPPGGFGQMDNFCQEVNQLMDISVKDVTDPSEMFTITWDVLGTAIVEIIKSNYLIGAVGGLNFTSGGIPIAIVGITTDNIAVEDVTIAKLSMMMELTVLDNPLRLFRRISLPDLNSIKLKLKRRFGDDWMDWDLEFDIASLIGKIDFLLGSIVDVASSITETINDMVNKIWDKIHDAINRLVIRITDVLESLGVVAELIAEVIRELLDIPQRMITAIREALESMVNGIVQKAIDMFKLISVRIALKATWDITKGLPAPVGPIATLTYLLGRLEKMVNRVIDFIDQLITTISETIAELKETVDAIIEIINTTLLNIVHVLNELVGIECSNTTCNLYDNGCDHRLLSWIGVDESIKPKSPELPEPPTKPESEEPPTSVDYPRVNPDEQGNPVVVKIPPDDQNWIIMQNNNPDSNEYIQARAALELSLDSAIPVPFDFADDAELKTLADAIPIG